MSTLIESKMGPDDQATPIVIYTKSSMSFGSIINNQAISPTRILLGDTLPDYLALYEAQHINTFGGTLGRPAKYPELFIPTRNVLGFHLAPGQKAELNYDPNEPNRVMQPAYIWLGIFLIEAEMRISTQTDLRTFLDIAKGTYMPVYNAKIASPTNPGLKPIQVDMLLINRLSVLVAGRDE